MQVKYLVQVIGSRSDTYTFPDESKITGTRFFSEFKDPNIDGVGTLDFFVNQQSMDFEIISKQKLPFYAIVYKTNKKWQFLQLSNGPK